MRELMPAQKRHFLLNKLYGRDRIHTHILSKLCYIKRVKWIWPRQNPHRHKLIFVLYISKHTKNMVATESAQTCTQTCIIFLKE